MKDYKIHPLEKDNWGVPVILQSLLQSRGTEISQEEIARNFPTVSENGRFTGFQFDEGVLNSFLNKLDLNSDFYNPFSEDYGDKFNWREMELGDILKELERDKKNLIAAFESDSKNHLALVYDFDPTERLVGLVDYIRPHHSRIHLPKLFEAMHPGDLEECQNTSYGFYVVGER